MAMAPQKRKHRDLLANKAPRTIFNSSLSSRRGILLANISLEDVKAIKKHFGVKVNDVVLAICGSALRSYLESQNALPEETLVAGVPISTRAEGDKNLDNQVGSLSVSLETHLKNPVQRLKRIHKRSAAAKEIASQMGATDVQAMGSALPPMAIELAAWMMSSARLDARMPLAANLIISNVPGPSFPLYICGGQVEAVYPLAPILVGMGVSITIMSYMKNLDFGLVFDPNLVPEPSLLVTGIENGVKELLLAIKS
jgi:diacylglycerol O-acyltransferase